MIIPLLESDAAREELQPFIDRMLEGRPSVAAKVRDLISDGSMDIPNPEPRRRHFVLV